MSKRRDIGDDGRAAAKGACDRQDHPDMPQPGIGAQRHRHAARAQSVRQCLAVAGQDRPVLASDQQQGGGIAFACPVDGLGLLGARPCAERRAADIDVEGGEVIGTRQPDQATDRAPIRA